MLSQLSDTVVVVEAHYPSQALTVTDLLFITLMDCSDGRAGSVLFLMVNATRSGILSTSGVLRPAESERMGNDGAHPGTQGPLVGPVSTWRVTAMM